MERGSVVVGIVVSALAAVIIGGLLYWTITDDGTPPITGGPEPATQKALAVVAVGVLGIEPESYDANPQSAEPNELAVSIGFEEGQNLFVEVAEDDSDEVGCSPTDGCESWPHDGGTIWLTWQELEPEEDPGVMTVAWLVDGERRAAAYSGVGIDGDPREADLPITVDDLVAVVTDPRFGLTTTALTNDTDLPGWPERSPE